MKFVNDKVEWLEFDILKGFSGIKHGSLLRYGGTSAAPFDSLNMTDSVGDSADSVKTNIDIVKKTFDVPNMVIPTQTHGIEIKYVDESNLHNVFSCDALITDRTNIALAVTTGDCQAALFYDTEKKVIAVAHAGIKGLSKNIYSNVIQFMKDEFGSNPKNILVAISPSLCSKHMRRDVPSEILEYKTGDNLFDLSAMAFAQLTKESILEKNIEKAKSCTFCDKGFFSTKRDKKTGRFATFIALV